MIDCYFTLNILKNIILTITIINNNQVENSEIVQAYSSIIL